MGLEANVVVIVLFAVSVALSGCGGGGPSPPNPSTPSPTPSPWLPQISAAVFLFEWSWHDVATECESFLAPNGFDSVYVSPPMEHINGSQWWTRYQPVSDKLISRSGNSAAFEDMIKRCNWVGIRVIVDVVINHMVAGQGIGLAGSSFGKRNFGSFKGGQSPGDFHHNKGDSSSNCGVIFPTTTKQNVWSCDLIGLPDLCTGCSHTKDAIVSFLKDIRSKASKPDDLGFRIDAAKHIDVGELQDILAAVGKPWNFGEVVPQGSAVVPSMYVGIGRVTEFNFAANIAQCFLKGELRGLDTLGEKWGLAPSNVSVTFMDNHDTQRGGGWGQAPLTYKSGPLYYLASAFMLATPYGYPVVMSSYEFNDSDKDKGPPEYPVQCGKGWVCEHRHPLVANMAMWRRVAKTTPIDTFQKGDKPNRIAFSRGAVAFLAINADNTSSWNANLQTGLPAGVYCDVMKSDQGSCHGVEVDKIGKASITVDVLNAVALHVGKMKIAMYEISV